MSFEQHGPRSTARLAEPSAHRKTLAPYEQEAPTNPPQRAEILRPNHRPGLRRRRGHPSPRMIKQREKSGLEVWFQDEMRVGQKNKLTYRWARKGSRPRAAHDQRTQSTYLFGAVCPELGTGAALVLPFCNSEAMQLHLNEIASKVSPGAHAIVILDQAGWHGAKELKVPRNISLMPLPPRSPELNSQENIWQFMRQNWLSNRIFKSYDDIVDHCCYAWNTLIDQPWKIMSIGLRDWAYIGRST